MTAPVPGDIEVEFNRTYIVVNPNAALGPPTYRISNPDEIAGGGGGGTVAADIDAIAPIVATTDGVTKKTEISMDIIQLDSREAP
tara:strand:+ start:339 stop:593 length:255 start_codon:yes stop_codon:yes gene_type:complete